MRWRRQEDAATQGPSKEAAQARKKAEQDLARRHAEGNRVRAMWSEWQRIREHNSIAANFEASMRGGRR